MTIHQPKTINDPDGTPYKTLLCHKVPLKKLIKKFRRIDLFKEHTQKIEELFVSVESNKGRFYYYIIPTEEFRDLLKRYMFTHIRMIEFIQQVRVRGNEKTYLDEFLISVDESEIIGSTWVDYKTKEEVFKFFKLEE